MLEVVKIRHATARDAAEIAAVHNAAWRKAYRGIVPDSHLDSLDDSRAARQWVEIFKTEFGSRYFHLVAEGSDGKVFGFAGGGPKREGPEPYSGELYAIYVEPQSQGRGVGRDLFLESCRQLQRLGHRGLVVWGLRKADNSHFYERLGGRAVDLQQVDLGTPLEEVCWAWDSVDQLIQTLETR